MTALVCFLFHSLLLPWQHLFSKYVSPRLPKGGPWNAVCPTYNYGLISNCLFLRIIPNGCAAKPLSTLSRDYSSFKRAVLMYVSPATGAILIWGRRLRDLSVNTERQRNTTVHFFLSSEAVCCPIVSPCKCANASCNPMYLHPLALCIRPGEQEPERRLM